MDIRLSVWDKCGAQWGAGTFVMPKARRVSRIFIRLSWSLRSEDARSACSFDIKTKIGDTRHRFAATNVPERPQRFVIGRAISFCTTLLDSSCWMNTCTSFTDSDEEIAVILPLSSG